VSAILRLALELTISVYIFVGCLILTGSILSYIAGAIVIFVGIGYVVLEFTPQVEPPSNMRDADAGWGAEQV
jgi:COPI associated protein